MTPPSPHETRLSARRDLCRRQIRRRRAVALTAVAAIVAVAVSASLALAEDETTHAVARTPPAAKAEPSAGARARATATVRFAATGDITFGSTPNLPPDGGRSLFAQAAPHLEGDVVLGNLETALADGSGSGGKCGRGSTNCFAFRAPPSYAGVLAGAGFTVLNLANNHSYDFGAAGQAQTVAALDRARLLSTGRPGEIAVQKVGSVRVAIVGFAPHTGAQDLRDLPAARTLVRRAVTRADLVVVTMHAGAEGRDADHVRRGTEMFLGENRGDVVAFSHAVVDAGADLVVGHGPHVLRAMEWYRGRLIAYSLGNFSAYKNFNITGTGGVSGILQATLRADGRWVEGELVPMRLVGDGTPVRDDAEAAHGLVRRLSQQDFGARGTRVGFDGSLRPSR